MPQNTPSKVIETLVCMGISISVDSIHNAVCSLPRETYERLRTMGQSKGVRIRQKMD
ncbi:hypothetical protein B0H14DRAFT_2412882 [Mycena olivaceomarginata]|nr:hypothetical protein B0H14DRAFT_2412882 [Mycena olivaceomarginata]